MLAEEAVPAAIALLREADDSRGQDQILRAADLWRRIVNAIPVDDPDYPDQPLHLAHLSLGSAELLPSSDRKTGSYLGERGRAQ